MRGRLRFVPFFFFHLLEERLVCVKGKYDKIQCTTYQVLLVQRQQLVEDEKISTGTLCEVIQFYLSAKTVLTFVPPDLANTYSSRHPYPSQMLQ